MRQENPPYLIDLLARTTWKTYGQGVRKIQNFWYLLTDENFPQLLSLFSLLIIDGSGLYGTSLIKDVDKVDIVLCLIWVV